MHGFKQLFAFFEILTIVPPCETIEAAVIATARRKTMQINLPEDIEALLRKKAAAAGFSNEIEAYVAHLVKADETEDYGSPAQLSVDRVSKTELDSMINMGMESGPASPMVDSDWQELHDRIDSRQSNS